MGEYLSPSSFIDFLLHVFLPFPARSFVSLRKFLGGSKKTDELANRGREDFTGFNGERGGVYIAGTKVGGEFNCLAFPSRALC